MQSVNVFVTNCSNSSRFCVFHNVFKVPFKFNYKTTEQATFLIRLSEYVRTGLLKLGYFQRRNTTATLKKGGGGRRKKRHEQRRETILRDIYLHSISHCSHSGASASFISGRFSFHYFLIAFVQTL